MKYFLQRFALIVAWKLFPFIFGFICGVAWCYGVIVLDLSNLPFNIPFYE